ncbi:MAG: sterol desaturase family protein [Verrucomicrobia bacterium]|nr:sterol desaturase family protein [Cytophagales bacterium]
MELAARELLVMFSTPLYAVLILAEMLLSKLQHKNYYTLKDTVVNISFMVIAILIELIMVATYFLLLHFFYTHRFFTIENVWSYWLVLLVVEDFIFYWLHYLEHHSRFFWAVHATHHSSEQFNLTVGFRSSVFQPLYRFVFFIPLCVMGFKIPDILLMYSATQIWGILIHTEYVGKLGFLEHILSTPSNHRVHHASNIPYLDKNIGMVFIFWDKIFGTFTSEDNSQKTVYGLTKKINLDNPDELLFHEWKEIMLDLKKNVSWQDKLKYLFAPPGWSHDGSRKTTSQLQQEHKKTGMIC